MEMGCLVMVGQLKGMGTRLLNHHVKKGSMIVVNLFPSTASFGAYFLSIINKYYVIQYRCLCRDWWLSLSKGRRGLGIHQRAPQ